MEDDYSPFVIIRRFDEYKKWGINYDKMLNLSSLGLIEMNLGPLAIAILLNVILLQQRLNIMIMNTSLIIKIQLV